MVIERSLFIGRMHPGPRGPKAPDGLKSGLTGGGKRRSSRRWPRRTRALRNRDGAGRGVGLQNILQRRRLDRRHPTQRTLHPFPNPAEGAASGQNSPTAASLAPLSAAVAVPPVRAASNARRRQGNAS